MKKLFILFLVLTALPLCGYAATAQEDYQAGLAAYQKWKWGEAVPELEKAVQQNPKFWQAYLLLGYSYYHSNNIQKSIQNCDTSLQINPNNPPLKSFVEKLKAQKGQAFSTDHASSHSTEVKPSPTPPLPINQPTPGNTQSTTSGPEVHDSIYFYFSGAVPNAPSDFSTNWGSGGSFGAGYGIGLNKVISLVLNAQFSTFPLNLTVPGIQFSGGAFHTMMFLADGKFVLTGTDNPVALYAIGGIGPAEFISDSVTQTNTATKKSTTDNSTALSETDLAFRLGLGIEFRIGKGTALLLEGNGMETLVSSAVAPGGTLTNGLFSLGMKFDQ